jgi:hypothetical protein
VERRIVREGVLADEIAASIANPILFPDIEEVKGTKIDPGADRVSAVPLQSACLKFRGHQFIVSNVTGSPAFLSGDVDCSYQELLHDPVSVEATRAIAGRDPELSKLVHAGFRRANSELRWSDLPKGRKVTNTSALFFRKLRVSVRLPERMPSGESWDAFGGKPDPHLSAKIEGCTGCDLYGTSAGRSFETSSEDTLLLHLDLGIVALRSGFELHLSLTDQDVSDDDSIASESFVLSESAEPMSAHNEGTHFSVSLSSADP